ncbi:MAG: type 1 glutamine amidotransferase domain-containing protein [Mycobacterium sp.]|nr:type 1 glutamine amidotransferase domain-containing protein [Mycobacterium sp.]
MGAALPARQIGSYKPNCPRSQRHPSLTSSACHPPTRGYGSERFGALLAEFTAQGKPVAAVCHGPAALLSARNADGTWLFSGRKVTGFSNTEEEQVGFADKACWLLENRLTAEGGAYQQSGTPWSPHIIVDGNLYTGENPASSEPLAKALVARFAASARV